MTSPKLSTYKEITPLIYSWSTPSIPQYEGWEKIGYTEQESAEKRISQQASQLAIEKNIEWVQRAYFTSVAGGSFKDTDFHAYLKQQGIEREFNPNATPHRTEWHRFAGQPKSSLEYLQAFQSQVKPAGQLGAVDDYKLRPEQQAAVKQALEVFTSGHDEMLWNAKPRFGKTLATYDLMRELDAWKVLIVTNRPAIANSWLDDFERFIGHQTDYLFVSESASLASRSPMSRDEWTKAVINDATDSLRIVEFVSLQDLKGSQYFGGVHKKLKHIADYEWDLLVIDEAHEGVETLRTDVAFDRIKRSWTLHLSGTPFKALASGRFSEEQIFNWTYEDEQTARQDWHDDAEENPYEALPTLNMLTYQVSRMITDRLAEGVALAEDEANIDFTFDLNEFFCTKENGFFEHEEEVMKFLDCLAQNEKYPFSTPELREEIRHSFWLLNRVASAKALQRLLNKHEVFKDYRVVLAAGDGKNADSDASDAEAVGKSFDRVKAAIEAAELEGGNTITLSVGQLTTGVTVPEWTAVMMLSNLSSPALYMQAAFRAQNPCSFMRGNSVFQKKNAYIFDFAPERTLRIFDDFANNLSPTPSLDQSVRQENIKTLLNFFPVIGEDSEGRMVELDAAQVLTFPQVFKAREVVRRGFLSNLLFANVGGIFRYTEHVREILEKLPEAKQGRMKDGQKIEMPVSPPVVDEEGNVQVDYETVINPKVAELGKPVWRIEDITSAPIESQSPVQKVAREVAKLVTEKAQSTREQLKEEYGLSAKQVARDEAQTEARVRVEVERVLMQRGIDEKRLEDKREQAATEAEAFEVDQEIAEHEAAFNQQILAVVSAHTEEIVPEIVKREETKKEQRRANETMDDARSHLRGFARTIPMFLMAYGDRGLRLANFDDYTPDDVFLEITGITETEFRVLRDGQEVIEEDGTIVQIPGMFDESVFDKAVQEFLDKKEQLADYFDGAQTEDIFAYIPQQKTSLVFTPKAVVKTMVDVLEAENPGIFSDPDKTFADLFSTAGLFLMELVRRLDSGLAEQIPNQVDRLKHIFTKQIFEMSHNELLHEITLEAVSGGVQERREWLKRSGHFRYGNLAHMSVEERQKIVDDMLSEGN